MARRLTSPAGRSLPVIWLLLSSPALAGTLCGTVRDAVTLAPVARAGVFVRLTDWTWTGLFAASDVDGTWCIDGVPAGVYHLDVRVDDYRIGLLRNVVVTDAASGVDIAVQLPPVAIDAPWPNPARGRVSFRLRLGASGAASVSVHDVAGRRVRTWADGNAAAGERTLEWDFHDAQGREVPAGRYYLRLEAGGTVVTRPFVRVR